MSYTKIKITVARELAEKAKQRALMLINKARDMRHDLEKDHNNLKAQIRIDAINEGKSSVWYKFWSYFGFTFSDHQCIALGTISCHDNFLDDCEYYAGIHSCGQIELSVAYSINVSASKVLALCNAGSDEIFISGEDLVNISHNQFI